MNVSRAAQNSAFKNHPTDILSGENHLYGIVLVYIIHKTALNTTKQLQVAGYKILKIAQNSNFSLTASLPHSLPHSLTDHSCKPRAQNEVAHSHHFIPQQQIHQWDVPFWVPTSVRPVCLVFPFIFNQVGCLLLQASKPYRGVNFPYQHFSDICC